MNSNNRSKKDLLKEHDPELVDEHYSRTVQPIARQPIVQTPHAFDNMVLKLCATIMELENLNTPESSEKAADIAAGLSSIKMVLNYRGNTYSGPDFFCTTCSECLGPKGRQEHLGLGHIIAEQDPNKPLPGFAIPPNTLGLGLPCLFSRSGPSFQRHIQLYGGNLQTLEERMELIKNGVTEHTKKGVPGADPQIYAAWKQRHDARQEERFMADHPAIGDAERNKILTELGMEPTIATSVLSEIAYGFHQVKIPHNTICVCRHCIVARSSNFCQLKFCYPRSEETTGPDNKQIRHIAPRCADSFLFKELLQLYKQLQQQLPENDAKKVEARAEDKAHLIEMIVKLMKYLDELEGRNYNEGLSDVRKRYFLSPAEAAILAQC